MITCHGESCALVGMNRQVLAECCLAIFEPQTIAVHSRGKCQKCQSWLLEGLLLSISSGIGITLSCFRAVLK